MRAEGKETSRSILLCSRQIWLSTLRGGNDGPVRNADSWLEPGLGARMEKYTAQRERDTGICVGSIAPTSDLTT